MERGKILTNYTSDIGLVSRMFEELKVLNIKKRKKITEILGTDKQIP